MFDVKVQQKGAPPMMLRDMEGGELVTFEAHRDSAAQDGLLHVRYETVDPVTRLRRKVIVPAQLGMDLLVDPELLGVNTVREEVIEEVVEEEEEEDRRKMRSSIKGDPILKRAKY
jgi:hypothetical protein